MTTTNNLEKDGRLERNPFAELIAEIAQIKISGSLRVSNEQQKIIIYFDKGDIVFAVSNSRKHRLFEILLSQEQISKDNLTKIENFTNDLYLAKELVKQNIFTKENLDFLFSYQIIAIIESALSFEKGEWTFSSLARIKDGIRFDVDINSQFYKYAKRMDLQIVLGRFKTFDENFWLNPQKPTNIPNFSPQEGFILSRISENPLSIDDLKAISGLPSNDILQILYCLWLGGFVQRGKWNSAFSLEEISKMNSASFTLKTSALSVRGEQQKAEDLRVKEAEEEVEEANRIEEEEEAKKIAEKEKEKAKKSQQVKLTLEEYIDRIEKAATHYEIFDLPPNAKLDEIKNNYFALAKSFHPDLFQKTVEPELHTKIQHAFTEIAQAYDTLKDEEAREVYDFKLRKVLEKLKIENVDDTSKLSKEEFEDSSQKTMASDNFDKGYDYLMNAEYDDALPFLGRAVHLDDSNPRYHAFYGKALSFDKSKRHIAEAELQTAIRLDSENTVYRIMLVELFIEIGLKVRAKGELNRLLEIAPNSREAQSMLDSLS